MFGRIYKPILKKSFYWWIQRDINRYIRLIEGKSLKRSVESKPSHERESEEQAVGQGLLSNIWNYGTFLAVNTFHVGQAGEYASNQKEEAARVTEDLIRQFQANIARQDQYQVDPSVIFPRPDYSFYRDEGPVAYDADRESSTGSVQNNAQSNQEASSIISRVKLMLGGMNFQEIVNTLARDRTVRMMIKSMMTTMFVRGSKWSWRPSAKHYLGLVWHLLSQAVSDNEHFAQKYGIRFETDGEVRCFYNVMNLYIHFIAVHGKIKLSYEEREIMFAVSSLHPLQDDYLDTYGATEEAIGAIARKLEGLDAPLLDERIEKIYAMIDVIYRKYPTEQHPELVEIFTSLHRWQVLSIKQKDEFITDEELLKISYRKGGYAFALFGYVTLGEMNVKQFNHFYTMGAIFQICDDLHDIEDDLELGVVTVWTRAIHQGIQLDEIMNATIGLQKYYEENTTLVSDFKNPVLVRRIELIGLRYDLFRFYAMNSKYFSETYRRKLEGCFPFRLQMARSFFASTRQYESLDIFRKLLQQMKDIMLA